MDNTIKQHRLGESLAYHILPDVAIIAGCVLITFFICGAGLPSAIGISLAMVFAVFR